MTYRHPSRNEAHVQNPYRNGLFTLAQVSYCGAVPVHAVGLHCKAIKPMVNTGGQHDNHR